MLDRSTLSPRVFQNISGANKSLHSLSAALLRNILKCFGLRKSSYLNKNPMASGSLSCVDIVAGSCGAGFALHHGPKSRLCSRYVMIKTDIVCFDWNVEGIEGIEWNFIGHIYCTNMNFVQQNLASVFWNTRQPLWGTQGPDADLVSVLWSRIFLLRGYGANHCTLAEGASCRWLWVRSSWMF